MIARRLFRESLIVLMFVFLTILNTWPLVLNMGSAVSDPGDPYLVTWILEWNWWATTHRPLSLFQAPIFHPSPYAFAFSEHLYGIALLHFPLYAIGVPPLTIYNIAVVLGFALSGYGAFVLARLVTGALVPSLCAGIFYAFVPFRFTHLPHLPHVWGASLPLLLAALIYYIRRPSWRRAWLVGAAFLWNGLTNVHWLFFGGIAFALSCGYVLLTNRESRRRSFIAPLVTATIVSALLLLPFLIPYRTMSKIYKIERTRGEAMGGSARAIDWFIMLPPNKLYGDLANKKYASPERLLFPGILSILFTAAAILLARRDDLPEERWSRVPGPESGIQSDVTSANSEAGTPHPGPWTRDPRPATRNPGRFIGRLPILDAFIVATAVAAYYQWADEKEWTINFGSVALALLFIRFTIRFPDALGGRREWSLARGVRVFLTSIRPDPNRRRFNVAIRLAVLWFILGILGSRGMRLFFYQFLFENVYGFRSIRAPARMAMIAYVGMAVLIAVGIIALLRRAPAKWKTAGATAIALLFLVELRAAPIRWFLALPEPAPVYAWLASAPISGAVAEFPFGNWEEAEYVMRQTAHHRPLVNGVSGYFPEVHARIAQMSLQDPVPASLLDELERIGCSILVIHNDQWGATPAIRRWVQENVAANRLTFVRRFEHEAEADYVYAVNRNERATPQLRAPEVPDPSGLTPSQKAERFLAGEARLYNARTFATLDEPTWTTDARGRLRVSGWALSPHGIKAVNLRFENGQVVIPADLWAWGDINKLYPWYPRTTTPGFIKEFDSRPDGILAETDLQVEILDGSGARTLLENVHFRWLPQRGSNIKHWNQAALDNLLARLGYDARSQRDEVLGGRVPVEQLAYGWAATLAGRTDEAFVDAAFRAILSREADPTGRQFYLDKLRRGESRRDIVDAFFRSDEFARAHEQ